MCQLSIWGIYYQSPGGTGLVEPQLENCKEMEHPTWRISDFTGFMLSNPEEHSYD